MELVKKIIFVIIILFYGCKDSSSIKQSKTVNTNVLKADTTITDDKVKGEIKVIEPIILNNLKCFEKKYEKGVQNDGKETSYKNEIFSLKIDDKAFDSNLVIISDNNKSTYILKDDTYEMADFNMKIYRMENSFILIFETIDYYSSTIYMYIYIDGVLTRLGDISIDQPDVEEERIKEESFKICKEDDIILIECFLDKKIVSTHKFKVKKKNIVKKQ